MTGSEAEDTRQAELSHLGSLRLAGEADETKLILINAVESAKGKVPTERRGPKEGGFSGWGTEGSLEDIAS